MGVLAQDGSEILSLLFFAAIIIGSLIVRARAASKARQQAGRSAGGPAPPEEVEVEVEAVEGPAGLPVVRLVRVPVARPVQKPAPAAPERRPEVPRVEVGPSAPARSPAKAPPRPAASPAPPRLSATIRSIARDRFAVRRAVVLSEVLGLPRGLKPFEGGAIPPPLRE